MSPPTRCWSCGQSHTGSVWCPHCKAPVDVGSEEARRSPYWQRDPRNPVQPITVGTGSVPASPALDDYPPIAEQRVEVVFCKACRKPLSLAGSVDHWCKAKGKVVRAPLCVTAVFVPAGQGEQETGEAESEPSAVKRWVDGFARPKGDRTQWHPATALYVNGQKVWPRPVEAQRPEPDTDEDLRRAAKESFEEAVALHQALDDAAAQILELEERLAGQGVPTTPEPSEVVDALAADLTALEKALRSKRYTVQVMPDPPRFEIIEAATGDYERILYVTLDAGSAGTEGA